MQPVPAQVDAQLNFTKSNGKALPRLLLIAGRERSPFRRPGDYQLHMQILERPGRLAARWKRNWQRTERCTFTETSHRRAQNNVLPTTDGLDNVSTELDLTSGPHTLSLSVSPDTSDNPIQIRLSWVTPEQQEGELPGGDRRCQDGRRLPWCSSGRKETRTFICPAIRTSWSKTLPQSTRIPLWCSTSAQPVAMPWLSKVKAVLQMWWPGDEGGWATANILLGKVSPCGQTAVHLGTQANGLSGHRSGASRAIWETIPMAPVYFPRAFLLDIAGLTSEGFNHYFPLGLGCPTRTSSTRLKVANAADGGLDVSFQIKNIGKVRQRRSSTGISGTARRTTARRAIRGARAGSL